MSLCANVALRKCHFAQMSLCANVALRKCHSTKIKFLPSSFWANLKVLESAKSIGFTMPLFKESTPTRKKPKTKHKHFNSNIFKKNNNLIEWNLGSECAAIPFLTDELNMKTKFSIFLDFSSSLDTISKTVSGDLKSIVYIYDFFHKNAATVLVAFLDLVMHHI